MGIWSGIAATNMLPDTDLAFPCSLYDAFIRFCIYTTDRLRTIDLPLPSARLATAALRALQVDQELSPLVHRSFSTISPSTAHAAGNSSLVKSEEETILRTEYQATTNRMLRVAVNGFMESLSVVLGIMEELDADVLGAKQSNR